MNVPDPVVLVCTVMVTSISRLPIRSKNMIMAPLFSATELLSTLRDTVIPVKLKNNFVV